MANEEAMSDKALWSAVFIAAIRAGLDTHAARDAAKYAVEQRKQAFPDKL